MTNDVRNTYCGVAKSSTGITTDTYAGTTIDSLGYERVTLILYNSDSTNSLSYKIDAYCYDGGAAYALVTETALTHGSSVKFAVAANESYAQIIVSVKSTSAGNHATYQIDRTLKGR